MSSADDSDSPSELSAAILMHDYTFEIDMVYLISFSVITQSSSLT